eukprot:gene18831-biopygen2454
MAVIGREQVHYFAGLAIHTAKNVDAVPHHFIIHVHMPNKPAVPSTHGAEACVRYGGNATHRWGPAVPWPNGIETVLCTRQFGKLDNGQILPGHQRCNECPS